MLASALVGGVLIGLAFGGDPRRLGHVRLELWPLFGFAAVLRFLALFPLPQDAQHSTYITSLWFFFLTGLANLLLPGVRLASLGIGLNAIVVTISGGTMPVSREAVAISGTRVPTDALHVVAPTPSALGDVIPIPLLGVYSIGDVVLSLGIGVFIVSCMREAQ